MAFLDYDGLKYFKEKNDAAYVKVNNNDYVKVYNNAGAHNAIYRGENLGTSVTDAQYAAIAAGTFEDLYIGDYWVINGVTWRIAAFDYYYYTGNPACTTHHVTIVPDSYLYSHVMNDTATTEGGYLGSKMYTEGLTQAKTIINNAFGEAHILTHRLHLTTTVTNGVPTGASWVDSTVELMAEQNVYGGRMVAAAHTGASNSAWGLADIDNRQYPLFALSAEALAFNIAKAIWLRNVASASYFCLASYGRSAADKASYANGVRPAFSIIG